MKGKAGTFDELSGLYAQCSEQNREKLLHTAKSLLKIQRENTALAAAAPERGRNSLKTATLPC
jgi:hypothetical protein